MPIYQSDPKRLPDSEFLPGSVEYLVAGNVCRLLDGRRTPGVIEEVFHDSAMFRWRITDFEHKGKHWDLPAEWVFRAQFAKDAQKISPDQLQELERVIEYFNGELVIEPRDGERAVTEAEIASLERSAQQWLRENSTFIADGNRLDLTARTGSELLAADLVAYLDAHNLAEHEARTAENYVLNPHSGEWIKGMEIVLAEMGLVGYRDKIARTPDIFEGLGSKQHRRKYLMHRLAFVRAYFRLLDIGEVVLYRGMKTESELKRVERRLISCSFNLRVSRELSDFSREKRYRNSYLAKLVVPVERLWMTFLETSQMNREYREAEAVILASPDDPVMW